MTSAERESEYEEQLNILSDRHGLQILDQENAHCIVERISAFRLWEYGSEFLNPENPERFLEGTCLEQLYQISLFDGELRSILRDALETIELQLRSCICTLLVSRYGPYGYLDIHNFSKVKSKRGTFIHTDTISRCMREVIRERPYLKKQCQLQSADQLRIPLWEAVDSFSFGNLTRLFSIMKREDRQQIASHFGYKTQYLGSWLVTLVEIRNLCCHQSRLYNRSFRNSPKLFKEDSWSSGIPEDRLFPIFIVLRRILGNSNQFYWSKLYDRLLGSTRKHYGKIQLSAFGFPVNWKEMLLN